MHALNHFRMLGRSGLRVSPICFGTMTMGKHREWATPPDECRRVIDMYADTGGNFLDTANIYQSEEVWWAIALKTAVTSSLSQRSSHSAWIKKTPIKAVTTVNPWRLLLRTLCAN